MNRFFALCALATMILVAPAYAGPRGLLTPEERAQLKAMSPEQRKAFRAQKRAEWKAKWQAMSAEDKAKFKAEKRAKWGRRGKRGHRAVTPEQRAQREALRARRKAFVESLSPQQRAEFKALRQQQRAMRRAHRGQGRRDGWQGPANRATASNDARWAELSPAERQQAQAMRDRWLSILDRK